MANPSLQIGDSNWAIKEDNLLGYSKAGTRFVPQPITMTRASAGTRVNSAGLVETVGSLGSELVDNGDFSEEGNEKITNRDFSEEGTEKVTNEDFATDSYWDNVGSNGWSIDTGTSTLNFTNASSYVFQGISTVSGKSYKVTLDIELDSGTINAKAFSAQNVLTVTSTGRQTLIGYFKEGDSNPNFGFVASSSATGKIHSVSVKEVGQDWTPLGTNATNTINFEANGVRFISVDQNISISQYSVLEVGKIYKFTCDVVTTTGVIGVDGAITEEGTINMTNGFNEIYFTASSNTFKIKRVNPVTNCLLSNVSVKEVGQDWIAQDGWIVEDNKAVCDGLFNNYIAQFLSLPVGNIKIKFTVDNYSSGTLNLWLNLPTFTSPISVTDDGDYEIYVTTLSGANNIYFYSVSFIGSIDNISVKEATIFDLARVDYTDGTSSLLVEPARTNLVTYSEDFSDSSWTSGNISVAISTVLSPDGTTYSYKLTNDAVSGNHFLRDVVTVTSGVPYTLSVFIKKGTRDIVSIGDGYNQNILANFDLTNGTVTNVSATSSSIESYNNGWFKCIATITPSTTNLGLMIFSGIVYAGKDESGDFYVWGGQAEQGSYATSYIPTYGTTVTRLKDQYEKTGISNLINSEEGSFFVDIAALNASPGAQISISLSGNGSNDRVLIYTGSGGGKWIAQFRKLVGVTPTTIVNIEKNTTITNQSKLAVSWKSGKYLMYIDGDKVTNYTTGSETEATTFDSGDLKNLQLSPFYNSSSNNFFGKVKQLQVYDTALTDSELETLTT